MDARIEQRGDDVIIAIKAVPNASRDEIAGVIGDRIKVRISAPPEDGKANTAICEVIAEALDIKRNRVSIESGHASAEKVVRVRNVRAGAVVEALCA